jgi:AcrR family transcriptional regulator
VTAGAPCRFDLDPPAVVDEVDELGAAGVHAPRGRPRCPKAHQAILEAAEELFLARGLGAVSMDTVAAQAGVSKATIYRRWPTKESLALDALYYDWAVVDPPAPGAGSVQADLLSLLSPWVHLLGKRPYGRVMAALIAEAQTDPGFAEEFRARFLGPRRELMHAIFSDAIECGELAADTDVELAADLLYGPLYHRLLHGHAPLDERFVRAVVDTVISGLLSKRDVRPPTVEDVVALETIEVVLEPIEVAAV